MNELFRMGRAGIVPRDYQNEAHDESFRLWENVVGVLIRSATGTGKTIMASLAIDTWLRRSENHRAMVVSYETQLVWQFADEIEEFTGITPGIEMEKYTASWENKIVVASRQSLLPAKEPTAEQLDQLESFGIRNIGAAPKRMVETCLKRLNKGADPLEVQDFISEINSRPEANGSRWARLHKFDWNYHWLVIFDEAHRHAYHLPSVGPIVDWFEQNPMHRRLGLTATPKRSDGVSIGDKMFPGIALDYPLYIASGRCAIRDGYAVKYVQKYVEVEGVDFRSPHLVDPKSESGFDDDQLAIELEKQLASFVLPTLELVENRRCLVFSPTVDMSKKVADFINARRRCQCSCGKVHWYTRSLLGSECLCECGEIVGLDQVIDGDSDPARELDGGSPPDERKEVYRQFRENRFQFLSVCGLCREGFNDPDVSAIACFRPVSKKASGLAEQMKGRACRIVRSLSSRLHEFPDAESRLQAIAESVKPNALVVDLVGITGLGDCASTVEIYAEGKPDEIIERAEELLVTGEVEDIEEAIEQAEDEETARVARIKEERREAERKAREEAERLAKLQAETKYSVHDVGFGDSDPNIASTGQYGFMAALGMKIDKVMSKGQAGRIITQLKQRVPFDEVAKTNRIQPEEWERVGPSAKQLGFAKWKGVDPSCAQNSYQLRLLIDSKLDPAKAAAVIEKDIQRARTTAELDGPRADLKLVIDTLPKQYVQALCEVGKAKKQQLEMPDTIPD